jgi:hypothetical protein
MWWTKPDKKVEEDRAKTEMELARALLEAEGETMPTWEEVKAKMDYDETIRQIKYAQLKAKQDILSIMVPYLANTGQIEHEEYAKYMLDETGMYVPKLKIKK